MNKIFKRIAYVVSFSLLIIAFSISVLAWNPPKVDKYVREEVEFRSVWVCTVSNMDISKQASSSESSIQAWKNEYLDILNNSKELGMNAIIFQVRPNNDAFYPSKYNPWSEFLAGYGVDPGWDPLGWMIEVTHAAGLEYHAWLNPYRTSVSALSYYPLKKDSATNSSYWTDHDEAEAYNFKQSYFADKKQVLEANNNVVDNPILDTGEALNQEVVYGAEDKFVLNPAHPKTIELLNNTITELIENYDIDGIHFDDYFYPDDKNYKGSNTSYRNITFSTEPNIDYNDYLAYKDKGGTDTIYNWRRENVNNLIHSLSDIIREYNKTAEYKCAFGISPAARWAPSPEACPVDSPRSAEGGEDSGCNNYYSYSDLYADTRKWVKEDWIDYILPQAYTYLGSAVNGTPTNTYSGIVNWWSNQVVGTKCKLYIGTPAYQIATWSADDRANKLELFYQIRYCQTKKFNVSGFVMFRYKSLISGVSATAMNQVTKYLWNMAALTPTYDSYEYEKLSTNAEVKTLKLNIDGTYTVSYDLVDKAKGYAVREDGEVIGRVLGKDNEITFSVNEGTDYELITYSPDNSIVESVDKINLSAAEINSSPTVKLKEELKESYPTASTMTVNFEVNDVDGDDLKYVLYLVRSGQEYKVLTGNVVDNKVTYNLKTDSFDYNDLWFKIEVYEVGNEANKVVFETSKFSFVSEVVQPTDPEPTPDPEPTLSEPETPKKKCGKKSMIIVELLSLGTLLAFILRKRH